MTSTKFFSQRPKTGDRTLTTYGDTFLLQNSDDESIASTINLNLPDVYPNLPDFRDVHTAKKRRRDWYHQFDERQNPVPTFDMEVSDDELPTFTTSGGTTTSGPYGYWDTSTSFGTTFGSTGYGSSTYHDLVNAIRKIAGRAPKDMTKYYNTSTYYSDGRVHAQLRDKRPYYIDGMPFFLVSPKPIFVHNAPGTQGTQRTVCKPGSKIYEKLLKAYQRRLRYSVKKKISYKNRRPIYKYKTWGNKKYKSTYKRKYSTFKRKPSYRTRSSYYRRKSYY